MHRSWCFCVIHWDTVRPLTYSHTHTVSDAVRRNVNWILNWPFNLVLLLLSWIENPNRISIRFIAFGDASDYQPLMTLLSRNDTHGLFVKVTSYNGDDYMTPCTSICDACFSLLLRHGSFERKQTDWITLAKWTHWHSQDWFECHSWNSQGKVIFPTDSESDITSTHRRHLLPISFRFHKTANQIKSKFLFFFLSSHPICFSIRTKK